ncbi:hypothetical protein GCM10029963_70400 [Micromonospora andamanensis]
MIHHVQLACPRGSEDLSRAFYVDILGLTELTKPPALAARGGCWFRGTAPNCTSAWRTTSVRPARRTPP